MNQTQILGFSPAKVSLDRASVDKIFLDFKNPRITGTEFNSEVELIEYMYVHYSLEELALSMSQFGYFDAEPIVAIPRDLPENFSKQSREELSKSEEYVQYIRDPKTEFTVVEGNRRLSTLKLLLNISGYKNLPFVRKEIFKTELKPEILADLSRIPVIVYPHRAEITPYLGVKHIGGSKPWETYAQALYISGLVDGEGYTFDQVKDLMSDVSGKVIKNYLALRLFDLADSQGLDTSGAKSFFSLLVLSLGQKSIKDYLGFGKSLSDIDPRSTEIIAEDKLENFKRYFKWIFGDPRNGTQAIISESRDITKKLTKILQNEKARLYLEKNGDIEGAFDRSDGDKDMILSGLSVSHRKLLNLRDTLDYLLTEGKIQVSDIKEEIFYLEKDIEAIREIITKHSPENNS